MNWIQLSPFVLRIWSLSSEINFEFPLCRSSELMFLHLQVINLPSVWYLWLSHLRLTPTTLYQSTLRSYRRNLIRYFWLLFQVCRLQSDFWPSTCTTGVLKGDSYIGASKIKLMKDYWNYWISSMNCAQILFLYKDTKTRNSLQEKTS